MYDYVEKAYERRFIAPGEMSKGEWVCAKACELALMPSALACGMPGFDALLLDVLRADSSDAMDRIADLRDELMDRAMAVANRTWANQHD